MDSTNIIVSFGACPLEASPPRREDQPVDLDGRVAPREPSVRGGDMCEGVEEVVIGPIGHRVMQSEATLDGPERYRSSDADDQNVVAIGAGDTIDRLGAPTPFVTSNAAQAVVQPCSNGAPLYPASRTRAGSGPGPLPHRPRIVDAHRVWKIIAEMGADVVDDRGDLLVGQQFAERRHALASVDDEEQRVASGCELGVPGQCRVGAGANRAYPLRHMAALANIGIERFARLRHEAQRIAEPLDRLGEC
jgi:hypothetical protein